MAMRLSMFKLVFALMTLFSVSTHSSVVTGRRPCRFTHPHAPELSAQISKQFMWVRALKFEDTTHLSGSLLLLFKIFLLFKPPELASSRKNKYKQTIEMTGPVITQILPSDGPFCKSTFNVSFYMPKENQADPPPAEGLQVQRWKPTYMAARQFSGFVEDSSVGKEAAALKSSLEGTVWGDAIQKNVGDGVYTVAQYNSPFEFENRVNEIWMMFHVEDQHALL
ncbi:hypothetical protein Dsin_021932 [Dipteronia sinensis]|uniref:SOUL heme-binding family protein n=1 Tax=Dipteronia sinensis TaxID=43782 RepID=A0AAE0A1J9_9ROSI|nr:hypothetical protein Dsin_021932 [Dipteronia sinensis]